MDTKLILLTRGEYAIIDNEDFEWLNQWKWFFDGKYAGRRNKTGDREIYMHRLINNTPEGFETDHINGNKLDNRRENLRTVTHQQNIFNRSRLPNNTSGYIGVSYDATTTNKYKKWLARIKLNYKLINLGRYLTPEEASNAYNQAAKQYFGEFRREGML